MARFRRPIDLKPTTSKRWSATSSAGPSKSGAHKVRSSIDAKSIASIDATRRKLQATTPAIQNRKQCHETAKRESVVANRSTRMAGIRRIPSSTAIGATPLAE
jgi:hypothetical protein